MGLFKNTESKATERIYEFASYIEGQVVGCREIEKHFDIDGKPVTQRYLEVTVIDEDGRAFYLRDKVVDHKDRYVRGTSGVFEIITHVEEKFKGKTTITINEFVAGCSLQLGQ